MNSAKAFAASVVASILAFLSAPGGAALAVYLILNVVNATLGKPAPADDLSFLARLDRLVDRLVVICRKGAENKVSLPLFGVSIFREASAFFDDESKKEADARATMTPPPNSSGGAALAALLVFSVFAAAVGEACRPRDPDGCTPFATRCSPLGVPQVCSHARYWSQSMTDQCPSGSVCGLAPIRPDGDGGARYAHRCARPENLVDAGIE